MSLLSNFPASLAMDHIGERFAQADLITIREERWAAQAVIALDTGDLHLVGLVLFKAIQEYGLYQFAEMVGETPIRLQRIWMPGALTSLERALELFTALGVTLPIEPYHATLLANFSASGASIH
ncbi:hypothetical protein [Cupriavidus plantarum]|uniref:hypothetical protein n=1 Tax=Cupriavidus plantarum TaxID=942865 RepID=UPI00339D58E1